ncbi:hypothetical protein ACWCXC_17130 [Streptomyces sp. NPDC001515]
MTELTVTERRTRVHQLARTGASQRAIAAQLGVGKDTVRRDLAHPAPPVETPAQQHARRAAQTDDAMRQLCAAAQAAIDADPAHTITDDETARRWWTELRATADSLLAHADRFADYYPGAGARVAEADGAP